MKLLIRRAVPADAAVLTHFNQQLALETEGKHLDPAVLEQGVRTVLADPSRGFYTVAENGAGDVVGQLMLTFEWSDWRNGWFWWVQSVYVRRDARRGGVFRSLFEAIHREAEKDPAVIGLRLYYDRANVPAHATYRSLGMNDTDYGLMELYPLAGRANAVG